MTEDKRLTQTVETLRFVARRIETGYSTAEDAEMIVEIADALEDGIIPLA